MKTTCTAVACLLLAACASSGEGGSSGWTETVLHGPPDVTITAPARITRNDLAGELPPVLVVGPPEVRASLFVFVDRDHDGQLGPAELIVRFLSIQDDVGCAIQGARLTSAQMNMAAKDTMWGVEVTVPGTSLKHVAIHAVE